MIEVEWIERDAVLERITHPVYRYRIHHLLNFRGQVVYQAYTNQPPYVVHEERSI